MQTDHTKKKPYFLFWLFAIGIAFSFVYGKYYGWINLGLPMDDISDGIIRFQTTKPAVYRVVVPAIARAINMLGVPPIHAVAFTMFSFSLASFWIIEKLCRLWIPAPKSYLHAVLSFFLLYILIMYNRSFYDYATIFIFCCAFYLMAKKDFNGYVMLFPFICLQRETSILLIVMFTLYTYDTMKRIDFETYLGLQFFTWFAVRMIMIWLFDNNRGYDLEYWHDPMRIYVQSPLFPAVILLAVGALWYIKRKWSYLPTFLQVGFALFLWQIVLHLILGYPYELRVLAEFFPLAYLAFVIPPHTFVWVGYFSRWSRNMRSTQDRRNESP